MKSLGIDIGSRTIKVAVINNGNVTISRKSENSFNTLEVCKKLLEGLDYDAITSTGYGRHLFAEHYKCNTISEIKAFAVGAAHILPSCRTVLDIGGQDTKAIALDGKGNFTKFEMNDKCAAGTGRFLEIMAMTLRYTLEEFGNEALKSNTATNISSMCTVFAESEVVSMLAKGNDRQSVAKGIHQSVVNRTISLLNRVGINNDILFAGGVAYNKCIVNILEEQLNKKVFINDDPQIIGALGAAIYGTY
ncbi:MAG: acyl-CoA dehydratase activase [Bacteroidales bacterium]|nr:acyl-CoA dehydratase activase [Bacteroidales bacterium]